MKVDCSIAAGDTAAKRPAISPAHRPPIDRASHHVAATVPTPASAMNAVTPIGSEPVSHAAGASSQ